MVRIDLSKLPKDTKVIDLSKGIDNGGRFSNYAIKDQEVLIQERFRLTQYKFIGRDLISVDTEERSMDDILALEQIWDNVFDKIRNREFPEEQAAEALRVIRHIDCSQDCLSKRMVSLLWIIPIFLSWNKERCIENGASEEVYTKFSDQVTELIVDKLGVP